ncbi:MAG: VanZ family protein [Cyanobacteria bacterium]|nr:VanZ family protein [Cyanobacteriota bacterium]MDW8202579.1 VanZ family protein [Cyanobacteriota bacterium SKYGB_h_bin112]
MRHYLLKRATLGWVVAAILYAGLFLITLQLAYAGKLPPIIQQIPFYDKIGHVSIYALATYLGQRALSLRQITVLSQRLPLWVTLFVVFTIVEEGIQAWSPNRTASTIDLVCSLLGIALGYGLAEHGRTKMNL